MPAPDGPVLHKARTLIQGLRESSGGNWIGYCPIHGEVPGRSTPSFSFNTVTGQWNCFSGCGGGGLPQLLLKLGRSREYVDRTMEHLRPHLKPVAAKKVVTATGGAFTTSYPLPERLLGLYEYAPVSLLDDGFEETVLRANDVGFDPQHERVTYAIRDLSGTLAGIAGRSVGPGSGPRYRVYEKEIVDLGFRDYHFNNKQYLWGWERVYPVVYGTGHRGPVYVTEGYKARLWLLQYGYPLTVALMGTSLSAVQQAFLERLGVRVVLCLDNDHWGRVGTSKIGYKLSKGVDVAVMRYPFPELPKLQPDDLSRAELVEALETPLTLRQWRTAYHDDIT